jgi:tetratricopeptide (TPR) repeat protein
MGRQTRHLWTAVIVVTCLPGLSQNPAAQAGNPTPPRSAESYADEGVRLAGEKRHDLAIQAFTQAIALKPDLVIAHVGLGTTYLNLGRLAEALPPLRRAVYLDSSHVSAHMNLGLTLSSMRRFDEAIVHLNEARRLRPGEPRIHEFVAAALQSNGRIEEALAAYTEALRLDPESADNTFSVGLMLMRLGRFEEAIEPLESAVRLNPKHDNFRYHLSNAYNRTLRFETAVDSFTVLLELRPGLPEGLQSRAWNALYAGGRGAMVAADATRFLEVVAWKHQTAPFMAIVASFGYRQAGQVAGAEAILDEAIARGKAEVWPSPVIRYLRGRQSLEDLLAEADTTDRRTEARAYIGLDLLLKGRGAEAREHLQWVRDYGNRRFLEYVLAVAELRRMGAQ